MKKIMIIAIVLVLAQFALTGYFYSSMPEQIVSHWNASGEANGYMGKFWGLFLLPVLTAIIVLGMEFLPRVDPLRKNVESFRKYYDGLIVVLAGFMLVLQTLIILWNMGIEISMNIFMSLSLFVLFYYMGLMLGHTKRNWFIGIRTPWTISSDYVWDKTHKIGGILFKVVAAVSLLGLFIPDYAIWISVGLIVLVALFSIVYSYVLYKKENNKN